jgi:hypothetical protein
MYKLIDKHPNPREIYKQQLLQRGEIDAELAREMETQFQALLQEKFEEAKGEFKPTPSAVKNTWEGWKHAGPKEIQIPANTKVSLEKIKAIGNKITQIPENNLPIKKVQSLFADRKKMIETGTIDWAMGELLAYATLLEEGHPVRLVGQDVERGNQIAKRPYRAAKIMFLFKHNIKCCTKQMYQAQHKNNLNIISYMKMPDDSSLNFKEIPKRICQCKMNTYSDEHRFGRYLFNTKNTIMHQNGRQ